ncbi:MAG: DUF2878 domain-containing protein [Desulfuromonadales bacterium]|nr:DUF2878 domain-containing protein [Desulfuromonadales bacterium]NIS44384.1 DUF2878 domain-containing protein [Desulfuromonadales bacterium]
MPGLAANITNITLYQLGWFSCVLGAAWGRPGLGAAGAMALIGAHLWLARSRKAEIRLMAGACLLGITVDSAQQAIGIFTFAGEPAWPLTVPLWVAVIWAQFATLFHFALKWLAGRYVLAAFLGMVGGPLAYGAGVELGAASFGGNVAMSMASLAVVWSLATPILLWWSEKTSASRGGYRQPF